MKTGVLRLLGGLKKIKKLWVIIMIIVLLTVNMGIFIFKDFGFGYRYYELNEKTNIEMTIGYSQEQKNILSIMDEYLKQLEVEGYYIASCEISKDIYTKVGVIPKQKINNEEIKQRIINSFDIDIFCKKVIIGEEIYYFKNEESKENFVNELNSIKKVEYSSEEVIENISIITQQDILDKKIDSIKEEKRIEDEQKRIEEQKRLEAQRKAEEKKKQQVSSRGGNSSRSEQQSSYSGGVPLASYVYISSPYGMRNGSMHTGVDFAAAGGTHVYAWKSGTVVKASWTGSYGNFIIVQHNDGTTSRYAHLSGYACSVGQTVSKGQVIGYVGTTGNSTGNHLHFEILINGNFVNPMNYL